MLQRAGLEGGGGETRVITHLAMHAHCMITSICGKLPFDIKLPPFEVFFQVNGFL